MYLNEEEILSIEAFCKNETMFEAVKKVLLRDIYSRGVLEKGLVHDPQINGAFSLASLSLNNPIPDEQLGQHIRGMWAGISSLVNAYGELKKIKSKKAEDNTPAENEGV